VGQPRAVYPADKGPNRYVEARTELKLTKNRCYAHPNNCKFYKKIRTAIENHRRQLGNIGEA